MKLADFYGGVEIHREEKIVYAKLLTSHRVLSTCRSSCGGMHDDLEYLYNHQSCEPAGHQISAELHKKIIDNPDEYKQAVAERYHLPFQKCATLGTAANMNNVALSHQKFRELEVVTVCTGGVEANAGRAGDPASYYEMGSAVEMLECHEDQKQGTINAMIFINQEMTPGAMVTAVITATEAKTAALQELEVPSHYSNGLATGTGTDQIAVASRLGGKTLTYAGKHSKLGELIGRTMHDAVKKTLALQNGLTPGGQCSSLAHLERFGVDKTRLCEGVGDFLSKDNVLLFERNFSNIANDPLTVAAVAALVHLRDKFIWGILPESCIPEVMCIYGAQISAAVSGKCDRHLVYMNELSLLKAKVDDYVFLEFIYQAFALGFSEKWCNLGEEASEEDASFDAELNASP
ncbi:MAG: adenosylcobinamide amidohydrolase [Methanothrix sp.]